MRKVKAISALAAVLLGFTTLFSYTNEPKEVTGYKPVYEDTAALYSVSYQPQAQSIENGGKIYLLGDTLYQVETGKGIHVIDVSKKDTPRNVGFISIRGCSEVVVKSNMIFTNNYDKLLALRFDTNGLKLLSRTPGSFIISEFQSLPPERGYFDCPVNIPGKIITGWVKTQLTNPKCFY